MVEPLSTLVIVDAQQGLLEGNNAVPDAPSLVKRLLNLISSARSAGALIIHLQNDGAHGMIDEPYTQGWFIHLDLVPESGEMVIRKTQDDGFVETELESILSRRSIKRIAIAGLLSEMCVSATVRGALERGLAVVLVHDAHSTFDLDDIPAAAVSRVAEHALGDEIKILDMEDLVFRKQGQIMTKLNVIKFDNPSELARHYFDDAPAGADSAEIPFDLMVARQEALDLYAEPAQKCRDQHCRNVTEEWAGSVRYLRIEPNNLDETLKGKVGIYYFGGGFITGSPELDMIVSAPLANELGIVMLSPEYRLAPEHPFPAGLDDCVAFYKHVVEQYGAENVLVAGESAGGNLAMATILMAKQEGIALPKVVVAQSPVLDQIGDASSPEHAYQHDPALPPEHIDRIQKIYSPGTPNDDPMVSPHFAEYGAWFPPILFTTGTRDVFQHQVRNSAEKLSASGVDVTVHLWEDMWHVFEYYPELPEATASIKNIADFVRNHL